MFRPDKYTLKPSLAEKFEGIIWKIEIDEHESIIGIETRNIANRATFFSAFDYKSGDCLFKDITVEDSWFWSLDKVHLRKVLLHSYMHQGSPEHMGIIAINCTGQTVWQHYNKTLEDITNDGFIAYNPKIQPKLLELLSPEDGSIIQNNISGYEPLLKNITLPDIISDAADLQHLLPENIVGPVFYKHHNKKDVLVFHQQTGEFFKQQLLVFENNNCIIQDNLATDIQKLNPEAFFIVRNHMFCIRNNKQELVAYLV